MQLYKYLPLPSDRMGTLWALSSIKDAYIIEYGPAGTTHYSIEGFMQMNAELRANLYTTHMDETNVVMGDCKRLEETIKEIDDVYNPSVIFVLASAISSIIGTDILNICDNLKQQVRAKLVALTGEGFRGDYTVGINEALTALALHVVEDSEDKIPDSYNIIGCNIDNFNYASDINEIQNLMKEYFGYRLNAVFTADSSISKIKEASKAEFNIVIRTEGIECAKILKERYKIPYYIGCPYGFNGTVNWLKGIEETFGIRGDEIFIKQQIKNKANLLMRIKQLTFSLSKLKGILSGNIDFAANILPYLTDELGIEITKIIVNHTLQNKSDCIIDQTISKKFLFNLSEEEKQELIDIEEPQILIGDGVLLRIGEKVPIKIQVSNPNLQQIKVYNNTPFMGFNGAVYLLEILLNQISNNYKHLKSNF